MDIAAFEYSSFGRDNGQYGLMWPQNEGEVMYAGDLRKGRPRSQGGVMEEGGFFSKADIVSVTLGVDPTYSMLPLPQGTVGAVL